MRLDLRLAVACPKCGYWESLVRWHRTEAGCKLPFKDYFPGEHMHHRCDQCHYEWQSEPLDKRGEWFLAPEGTDVLRVGEATDAS